MALPALALLTKIPTGFKTGAKIALVLGVLATWPVTYFAGKGNGREELLMEIAEANAGKTEEQVRENVKRAERAILAIEDTKKAISQQQKEFENAIENNPDGCTCTASPDELREYNELVREGNRSLPRNDP